MRILLALALGAAAGAFWWGAYAPAALPLAPLLLSHALAALLLERALSVLGTRWRGPGPLVLGALFGLMLAPAVVQPVHALGLIGGKAGVVIDAGAMLILALAGAVIGRGLQSGGRGLLGSGAALLVMCGATAGARLKMPADDEVIIPPQASKAGEAFPKQKVAIIGIDGADWDIIDPLLEAGSLPNLAKLINGGQRGVLRSIEPMYSPVVWTTIFSGQMPDKHGIVDWYRSDARSRRVPMLWDIVGAHGLSSLTVNVPGTWPPSPVERGQMLAGFPIPGLTTGEKGQSLGAVLSTEGESGDVPTYKLVADGAGFAVALPLAAPELRARWAGLRHPILDAMVRKQWLHPQGPELNLSVRFKDGKVHIGGPELASEQVTVPGEWSGWLKVHTDELDAVLKAYVLDASAEKVRLYLTPAYQAPWAPRFPFAVGVDPDSFKYGEPYVVEGLGWLAHRDPRVAALVPTALDAIEEGHASMVESLTMQKDPDLLSYVITLTDRNQHPFWSLHEGGEAPPGLENEDPVAVATRYADNIVGRLVGRLSPDTLVLIVSDHGFTRGEGHGEGAHRAEGIWIASGPMVPPDPTPHELGVADIVPTVLRCMGAPVAEDMAGIASVALCPEVDVPPSVKTWQEGEAVAHDVRIGTSQEEQLEALGYIERN